MLSAMNRETQHRKKDPTRLYRRLLEAAAMIAGRDGIAALSLNAVASKAGVSKGGLLHHFPNKQALIFALFHRLLAIMEQAIVELMAADNIGYGRFTRAYLRYLSDPHLTDTHESRQLMVLSLAMPDEPVLRQCWRDWILNHLAQGDGAGQQPYRHPGSLQRGRHLAVGVDRRSHDERQPSTIAGQRSDKDDASRVQHLD